MAIVLIVLINALILVDTAISMFFLIASLDFEIVCTLFLLHRIYSTSYCFSQVSMRVLCNHHFRFTTVHHMLSSSVCAMQSWFGNQIPLFHSTLQIPCIYPIARFYCFLLSLFIIYLYLFQSLASLSHDPSFFVLLLFCRSSFQFSLGFSDFYFIRHNQ